MSRSVVWLAAAILLGIVLGVILQAYLHPAFLIEWGSLLGFCS